MLLYVFLIVIMQWDCCISRQGLWIYSLVSDPQLLFIAIYSHFLTVINDLGLEKFCSV